ncbi:ssDNA endonuclease and repair protein rad10 [Puccinia graminis f. sp. tritici]|uniref:DNA excision repair protein ERCC-1 n=1 Tax=Puccinia graminis f. sp. tritici TaxID=56615 RepID=A0A5B0MYR1_PUCGR|nr:ssDNA endonuclease and repair protein rad10 [Puccinia graminis f. sp. tritici]KAA1131135.1 ssDNA endonuclease and repair protein rad10 [Puccinia graminis f. sp. tritici]
MPFVNKNNQLTNAPSVPTQPSTSSASTSTGASNTSSSIPPANDIQNRPVALNRPANSNNIIVNKCQRGNPVLTLIKSVPWEFGETISDYQLNQTTGSLFISLKYHRLHPDYLDTRLKKLIKAYDLKILLCLCDSNDHEVVMKDITKTCMVNEFTLIVAWSNAEIARYIQLFKSFEKRPPDLIKEKIDNDYMSQLTSVLTTIRGLNKTDVMTLATNFRSFRQIVEASPSELSLCPGLGEKKVKRLLEAFNSDFRNFPKSNESANN